MQKLRPDMDIGHNIQRLRRKVNMTQDQVVAHLQLLGIEISKSTYAKLETNRMNIKVSELVALSKIFNADISEFFDGLVYFSAVKSEPIHKFYVCKNNKP